MQYKQSTKIIIDKRKLDTLIRLGCPNESILSVITTGNFNKTNDSLLDEMLESLVDIKEFKNWGGKRENSGRKNHLEKQDENQLEKQDENQLEKQDGCQVVDKDKDRDIDKEYNNITDSNIKDALVKWFAYKKERKQSYKPIGEKECIAKLEKLSGNNPVIAMQIVDESISNGWSGLFPLKNKKTKAQTTDEHNWEIIKNTFGLEG